MFLLPSIVCRKRSAITTPSAATCSLDAGADGTERTVAVDWAFAGIGAVGADLAPLIVGSLLFFEVADAAPQDLAETALAAYMSGLREAGSKGMSSWLRLGFLATAALLYTIGPFRIVVSQI